VNRQLKRMQAKQEREEKARPTPARRPTPQPAARKRVGPRQFFSEVVGEMRKVLWPSGQRVRISTVIVLVTVIVLTAYIYGLDSLFIKLVQLLITSNSGS
jgi:preprotein translocase subunit SecE